MHFLCMFKKDSKKVYNLDKIFDRFTNFRTRRDIEYNIIFSCDLFHCKDIFSLTELNI